MRRVIDESRYVSIGQMYLVAKQKGGNGRFGNYPFQDGLFFNGSPIDGSVALQIRNVGYRVYCFPWEENIKIEWVPQSGEPIAYIEEKEKVISEKNNTVKIIIPKKIKKNKTKKTSKKRGRPKKK